MGTQWARLVSPRVLLSLAVMVGVLGAQAGGGTLAFFSSTANSGSNLFVTGTLDITTSSLPSAAAFKWDTTGKGAACDVISGATVNNAAQDILDERMAPNEQCTTVVTLTNSGNLTSNVRLRLIRTSATGTAANDALNSALEVSLAERAGAADNSLCDKDFDYTGGEVGWTTLLDGQTIGGDLGVSSFLAAPTGLSDVIAGGQGADLWGGTAGDNAPDADEQLDGGASSHFCMQVALPSAGLPTSNTTEDNLLQTGTVTYTFVADAIQAAGR